MARRPFARPLTFDELLETAIVMLSKHALLANDVNILHPDGTAARIVKFRNFSGVEVKERGLTLSIFPYHYEGASRPTPESKNSSVVFSSHHMTGGSDPTRPTDATDFAVANFKVRLDMLGYTQRTKPTQVVGENAGRGLFGVPVVQYAVETNDGERVLRQWMDYLRVILTSDLFNLGGLVKGSQVNWINFPTTQWDAGGNSILHTAELLWQVYYFPLRDWKTEGPVRSRDTLIGSLQADGAPVFWRPDHDVLMTGFGTVILNTPQGLPVTWDPNTKALVDSKTREPLSREALLARGSDKEFVRLDLLPIGVLTKTDLPLYYDKVSRRIVQFDGAEFGQIPGPRAKLDKDGNLDLTDTSSWISIAWDEGHRVLVYGAAEGDLAGKPVVTVDQIDPTTGDLYLITGQVFGLNVETRPPVREFLLFDANA